jgi:hypothetical protein
MRAMSNRDFDFLFGSWTIRNRRLKDPLTGSTEWVEFDSTCVARPVWGGTANMDEYVALDSPLGEIYGVTIRLYNEQSRQWSIYWGNRKYGKLDAPMTGAWSNGRGEFYDQELFRDRMIYVRFLWTNDSPDSARWEQSFSEDGGTTWETNWVMEFMRTA